MLKNYPRIRIALYVASVVVSVAAPFAALADPQLGAAVTTAATVLATAAGATALANLDRGEDMPSIGGLQSGPPAHGDHAA